MLPLVRLHCAEGVAANAMSALASPEFVPARRNAANGSAKSMVVAVVGGRVVMICKAHTSLGKHKETTNSRDRIDSWLSQSKDNNARDVCGVLRSNVIVCPAAP
jgi:hypothetical protein